MKFSKSAKLAGMSGFFFDNDKNAPDDAITVSDADVGGATNLPAGSDYDFDKDGKLTVTLPPPLSAAEVRATAIAAKWSSIKAERDRRRFDGGVKVGVNWFLSNQVAIGEYNTLLAISNGMPDETILRSGWRTMKDGVIVDMTVGLVKQILTAGVAHVAAIDDASQAHKAALEASGAPETYDYSTGWPLIYGE
jgi:hypothetical protein